MQIIKLNNSVKIIDNNSTYLFPMSSIILHYNDVSDTIDIKLNSSKYIMSINQKNVTNPSSTDAMDLFEKLQNLIN